MTVGLSSDMGYLRQFALVLAPNVERHVLGTDLHVMAKAVWWRSSKLRFDSTLTSHAMLAGNYSYSAETAQHLMDFSDLGLAVDDGRAGRQPWKLTALTLPASNHACWLYPQAGL